MRRKTGDTDALTEQVRMRRKLAQVCTGDPHTCRGLPYRVPTAPEEPICGVTNEVCDRRKAARYAEEVW